MCSDDGFTKNLLGVLALILVGFLGVLFEVGRERGGDDEIPFPV